MNDSIERSKGYVQLILGVGYLALFACWSFAEPFLTPRERAWSGLLGGLSVMFFILVEVLNLFFISLQALAPAVPKIKEKAPRFLVRFGVAVTKPTLFGYVVFWLLSWVISTFTGVASAAVILASFFRNLSCSL